MTYREIRDWIKSEIVFEESKSITREFDDISEIFFPDNRSSLENIIGTEKAEFLEFLESVKRDQHSETDEDLSDLESRLEAIESRIEELLRGVIKRSPV